jgi:hypothetical protein
MNPQLESYVKESRAAGRSDEGIKQSLIQSGWGQGDINMAFGMSSTPIAPTASMPPQHPGMATSNATPINSPMAGEFFDQQTKDTVMWSVIGYLIRSVVVGFATAIGASLFFSSVNVYGISVPVHQGFSFNFGSVIINSIVGGLIFGIILAKYFNKVREVNRKYFSGWFKSLYALIFSPAIFAGVLGLLLAGGFSF